MVAAEAPAPTAEAPDAANAAKKPPRKLPEDNPSRAGNLKWPFAAELETPPPSSRLHDLTKDWVLRFSMVPISRDYVSHYDGAGPGQKPPRAAYKNPFMDRFAERQP